MAVLKDLIVHGNSRFINIAQFDRLEANTGKFHYIEAASGSIDELTSKHIITQVLDVEKELHTKEWTNANIANIGGTFYIAPTIITKNTSPKITFSSTTSNNVTTYTITVNGTFATNFIKPGKNATATNWTSGSEILITGTVSNDTVDFPMGTLIGTLSGTHQVSASGTSKTITITNVTDSKGNKDILQEIINIFGTGQVNWLDGQLSLKTLGPDNPIGILLTSMGLDNKTYMDIYGGQKASGSPNVRIGDLNGITATINGLSRTLEGWGIFTDNGYFEGEITSTTGYIGGWYIGNTNLHNPSNRAAWNTNNSGIWIAADVIAGGAQSGSIMAAQSDGRYAATDPMWYLKSNGDVKFGDLTFINNVLTVPAANVTGTLSAGVIETNGLIIGDNLTEIAERSTSIEENSLYNSALLNEMIRTMDFMSWIQRSENASFTLLSGGQTFDNDTIYYQFNSSEGTYERVPLGPTFENIFNTTTTSSTTFNLTRTPLTGSEINVSASWGETDNEGNIIDESNAGSLNAVFIRGTSSTQTQQSLTVTYNGNTSFTFSGIAGAAIVINYSASVDGYYVMNEVITPITNFLQSHIKLDTEGIAIVGDTIDSSVYVTNLGVIIKQNGIPVGSFMGDTIVLGDQEQSHLELSPDRLGFYDSADEVAYLSQSALVIENSILNTSILQDFLQIGDFKWRTVGSNRIQLVFAKRSE